MSNRFVFIACFYNMEESITRMMHSIVGQSYDNWRVIITDDMSEGEWTYHDSANKVYHFEEMLNDTCSFDHPSKRIKFLYNTEKRWETENVLTMIRDHCEDDDIICRIDCDDALIDLDALAILNSVYETEKCDVAWTMHRWGLSDRNISGPLPENANPYTHPWVTSHLKTFRKKLLNGIPFENFTNMDGNLVRRCGDQAVYLPVLHHAKKRIFIPRPMYGYHIVENGGAVYQTDDAKFQKQEADFIRARGYISQGEAWEVKLGAVQAARKNSI